MHCTQKNNPEQGRFQPKRLVYDQPLEAKKIEAPKAEGTTVEALPTFARLEDMDAQLGISEPLKEMIKIQESIPQQGQTATYEYHHDGDVVTGTREGQKVVWRNGKSEIIEKTVWLKEKVDKENAVLKQNDAAYFAAVDKKYSGTEPEKLEELKKIQENLKKAEMAEIHDLQGGKDWDSVTMSNLFLDQQPGSGLRFKFNSRNNSKFDQFVGAADILPASVLEIAVTDLQGNTRIGKREIRDGRVGYFDAGYIPVFNGYGVEIKKTAPIASKEVQEEIALEQENHERMKGTFFHKSESAPTEIGPSSNPDVNPVTGNRYVTVEGKRVEVRPPSPNEKVYETKVPKQLGETVETATDFEQMSQLGRERLYIDVPKRSQKFEGKQPRVVVYFHGNGGSIDASLSVIKKQVEDMRAHGDPVILVVPENRLGGWQDFRQPGQLNSIMAYVDQFAGGLQGRGGIEYSSAAPISIASHSGGYLAVQRILESGEQYGRISSIGLLDSAYGNSNQQFIRFASDPSKKLYSTYTDHLAGENKQMMAELGVDPRTGTDATGRINIQPSKTNHSNVPGLYFEQFVS